MDDVMTVAERPAAAPAARQLRRRLRRVRRTHREGSIGDALTDAYIVVLVTVLYGWTGVSGIRDYLGSPDVQLTDSSAQAWIALAAVLVAVGLAWRALRLVGPLLVTPAAQTWVVSSPVDRRAWLLPRFALLLVGAAVGTGLLGALAAIAGGAGRGVDLAWAAMGGATAGAAAFALGVVAQAAGDPRWARLLGRALIAAGGAISLAAVAAHAIAGPSGGLALPLAPLVAGLGLVGLPVAVVAIIRSARVLGRIDRAGLTGGAEVASATMAATVMLDPSMLTRVVEIRRWRAVARVRSRPFGAGVLGRVRSRRVRLAWALGRSDLRRLLRHPGAITQWAALLLVMYAIAVALPSLSGPTHLILAYLAADRFTGGLRAITRSPGLRRALGGSDIAQRLAHAVVPGTGGLVWYLATLPAVGHGFGWIDVVFGLGVIVAAYRGATKPPIRYGGPALDTPLGLIPLDLLRQVFRGPDIMAILVAIQLLVT